VIPNGDGSEFVLTVLLDDGIDAAARARQVDVLEQELDAVRGLLESS
jgi:hypothetical protein